MKSKTLLTALGTALLTLMPYSNNTPDYTNHSFSQTSQTQTPSSQDSNGIKYTKIRERIAKKLGNETVKAEFGLESKLWESLKPGMTKQEFYTSIKQAPIELKTTTIFRGITGIRGYINSEDIREEFLNSADRFIKNKPSMYDPTLIFSKQDKEILKRMLERELKSNLTETIKPWNPFSSPKEAHIYPPKSQIFLRTDSKGNPSFEPCINTNPNTSDTPTYEKLPIAKITEKREKEVFTKFLLLSILTKDPENVVPIDNFYKEYLAASAARQQ